MFLYFKFLPLFKWEVGSGKHSDINLAMLKLVLFLGTSWTYSVTALLI